MPPQRGTRGSYARYICTNCRNRKIKCILPIDLDFLPSGKPQSEATSCHRCRTKGLDCIVGYTTLGRPAHGSASSKMRVNVSPQTSLDNSTTALSQPRSHASLDEGLHTEESIDDFLLSRPERSTDLHRNDSKQRQGCEEGLDKFLALVSPHYLLSTLLLRDKQFGISVHTPVINPAAELCGLLDEDTVSILDGRLVWHRLYYPDIPPLLELYQQSQRKDEVAQFSLATSFLFALLCCLALESCKDILQDRSRLECSLNKWVFTYGQQVLLSQPCHRKTVLGLELMTGFRPLALSTDRYTAALAVRGRLTPPLMRELALELGLDSAPAKLRSHQGPMDMSLLYDTLQWYRIILRDMNTALMGEGRQAERRQLGGELATEVLGCLQELVDSGVPKEAVYLTNSLLCKARQLENALRIKEDWRNLDNLGSVFEQHLQACEEHRERLKVTWRSLECLRAGEAMSISHLIDMELHRSFVFISGYATFHSIIAGAEVSRQASSGKDPSKEQMMELADQIIERLAEPTKEFHVHDPHTVFLVKYGDRRMGDIEKAFSDYISCMDTLKLDGIPYIGPVRQIACDALQLTKEIMEGQAARMKGWGGLHERVDVQLLLIRGCVSSLERIGSEATGESGVVALSKGCLWAATARLLRSLHGLLGQWKEWNALGQARVSAPSLTTKASDQVSAATGLEQVNMTDMHDFELLPDDLFFDWNMWQTSEESWSFV